MAKQSRRDFLKTASAVTLTATASSSLAAGSRQRVFIGSNTPDGILAYDWDPATAELSPAGVAAKLANVDWITYSPNQKYLYAASEVDSFNGKPTGEVASFRVRDGKLEPLSAQNSADKGTCYVALDPSLHMLLAADYGGGSAASFTITDGKLSAAVWTEHYTGSGPVADRQQTAHAHFASYAPNNQFAYINDLGSDCIHIYHVNPSSGELKAAGVYKAKPGSGPRTLHFHPNGHTAYSMNELNSTVDVLEWNKADGSLTRKSTFDLHPKTIPGVTSTGCDTVITKDGKFVYFANRGDDFLFSCRADEDTGALTPIGRSSCGGKIPRNFKLDPTERWMLVANQGSNQLCVFARDPVTGKLADKGKSFAAAAPMCILFT
jgi:6-phosphogluconolactonase